MTNPIHLHVQIHLGSGPIEIHHVIHDETMRAHVDDILARLAALQVQGDKLMSASTEILQVISDMNNATNQLAAEVEALRGRVTGGMSDAEAAEIKAQMVALRDRLIALGQDPQNPVPPTT
jgi:hypothetical protein